MIAHARWKPFPHPSPEYDYAGAKLHKAWTRLHRGDREPYPDAGWAEPLVAKRPALAPAGGIAGACAALQDAWRAFHRGDFGQAVELGLSVGLLGYDVANKATNIYATYLDPKEVSKLALFQAVAERAGKLAQVAPEIANAHYFRAQALGRYGQGISIAKALAIGLGGQVLEALKEAIALEPKHADAHIALGAYHAAVIAKVGAMVGKLTYGATKEQSVEHFEAALRLSPVSAIAHIEFANGLVQLFGKAKLARATELYRQAADIEPVDAMERLDVELAKAELADES